MLTAGGGQTVSTRFSTHSRSIQLHFNMFQHGLKRGGGGGQTDLTSLFNKIERICVEAKVETVSPGLRSSK